MNARRAVRSEDTDTRLIAGASAGDMTMFRELYRRHVGTVYARLTRLIGPVSERDDLVQQIFLDVHRGLPRFRGDAAFATFLYRIVVNVACEHLRRARRSRTWPFAPEELDVLVDPGASPETRAEKRRELAELFELLAGLRPKQRVAFVLVAVEGIDYDEAAAVLGVNPPAVKQRVLAARRALAARIDRAARKRGGAP
jgi:RNA polymerase sigma-70 factor (ECF subfamily)